LRSIGHHFYRKRWGIATITLVALAATAILAQSKKKETGPRALAVVEMPADGKSKPRLIPIAILVEGRFWDASIYRADPRPMALDPGNVYEVERSGKPTAFFTVSDSRPEKDRWIGFGDWQTIAEKPPVTAQASKPSPVEDEDRPVLHKRQPSSGEKEAQPAAPNPSPAAAPTAPPPAPDDPNRPVLRRGKPKPPPEVEEPPEQKTQAVSSPKGTALRAADVKSGELLAAISDAGGPEPRPYTYAWAPDEQPKLTKSVSDMAMVEVARYVRNAPALRYEPAPAFENVVVHVFDLNYDNNPEIVFTARVPAVVSPAARPRAAKPPPAPTFFFYVTVVGQPDLYGQVRKLFSSVTDSAHLDVFPRLDLIDAVDAEGTGRGNLLFRAVSGDSAGYQLYHVGPDSLRKLFGSGGRD